MKWPLTVVAAAIYSAELGKRGNGTEPDRNDWITDCSAQVQIRDLVDLLISNLS